MHLEERREVDRIVRDQTEPGLVPSSRPSLNGAQSVMQVSHGLHRTASFLLNIQYV